MSEAPAPYGKKLPSKPADESKADRIYARLMSKIKRGDFRGGERLPTEKQLAAEYGAALLTLRKALKRLREEGWIISRRYHGTVVADPAQQPKQRVVGLVIPRQAAAFSHPVFSKLVEGVEEILGEMGYALELVVSNPELPLQEELFLKKLDNEDISGWLVPARISERAQKMLVSLNRPRIVLHRINQTLGEHVFASDQEMNAEAVFEHLYQQGYRNIAILAPESARLQVGVYLESANRANAPAFEEVFHTITYDYGVAAGCAAAKEAIQKKGADALFCIDDEVALGAYQAIRQLGLSSPEVGVVGAGDFPFAAMMEPSLTSIAFPFHQVGREAARVLVDLIEGKEVKAFTRKFTGILKTRGSTDTSKLNQQQNVYQHKSE